MNEADSPSPDTSNLEAVTALRNQFREAGTLARLLESAARMQTAKLAAPAGDILYGANEIAEFPSATGSSDVGYST